jgi:ABC-type multidrug transport system ATPase subunit
VLRPWKLGAKIGILGGNGAGKSTLMKILAGVDTEFDGSFHLDDGIRAGPPHASRPRLSPTPLAHASRPRLTPHTSRPRLTPMPRTSHL